MSEDQQMAKIYDPGQVEEKWYQYWEQNGFFTPKVEPEQKPFSIVMPPPNVTGSLHLGHAMDNTLQDILARYKRMQGYNTLWLPGTDHAGIATQAKVEEQLAKEGTNRHELGREKFLERVWAWKEQYGGTITRQLRKLGASCDWSRERFTMDEGCSKAVREVFVNLYNKGLIYRGNYIVNWCSKCHTTISDIEVEHNEREGNLWHIRYPAADGGEGVVVATTRPETMLGDVAVAVHPEDERYRHLAGKNVILPLVKREIPVITDEYVEKEFGTGAVKITPAHDPNDFEMGLRHNLEQINIMNSDATINENGGKYQGLDRYEARRRIVKDLEELGLLVKIEPHTHAVGECYRCSTVVEPRVSRQWFVKMQPLAEPAIKVVQDGDLQFVPDRFARIYTGWLENIRDWCISRQLWWGHRIPVWYCQDCGAEVCVKEDPTACPKCGSHHLQQDPDVLDTWFSSALWPFSTMGWPENTAELKQFYPTSVLVTGRDIIFFWVARMIFMGLEFREDVPFHKVMIHGLILDPQGRKMSKSLGNGVDPIEVINQYGADTLRFMLITGNTPGNDLRFHFEKLESTRNFLNKIWNASRFVLMNLEDYQSEAKEQPAGPYVAELTLADKWILSRYEDTVQNVTAALERFDLGEAGRLLYEFIWNEYCDWYIELTKKRLYMKENQSERQTAQRILFEVLEGTMRLIHPFMPFLTEEIWQHLPIKGKTIMLSSWPQVEGYRNEQVEKDMNVLMDIIRAVRNIRAEMGVAPGRRADILLVAPEKDMLSVLQSGLADIRQLAVAENITILQQMENKPPQSASTVLTGVTVYIPLKGLLDLDKEVAKVRKEIENMIKEQKRLEDKLGNPGFTSKAPEVVVQKEKEKLDDIMARMRSLKLRLSDLSEELE
ncbi:MULTISPECIES: valine--tRNA ligase [Dehalobacter]|jgi:valyl-tRNA synthetase|uniref:Valine--tRNA ligase n=2 Tax=Dehalobacter restrictus TaxID=55583 RepID=A0A857DKL6_9FIRM|nr:MULTISPECIES: valine--tRNA ligase [Dehalobacter]AHF10837.1 valyl-tRNA synthase [Dehalobacter restrictus DSM 9455]OCZ52162.1 valine--tRNA ligase [Dehalobacter sp. TeCB1]QHA01487.1 valine--tRNA ligase [Dehalobacter restrictus]